MMSTSGDDYDKATQNLIKAYALPLPIQMLCNLLGVPVEDHDKFEKWASSTLARGAGGAPDDTAAGRAPQDVLRRAVHVPQ